MFSHSGNLDMKIASDKAAFNNVVWQNEQRRKWLDASQQKLSTLLKQCDEDKFPKDFSWQQLLNDHEVAQKDRLSLFKYALQKGKIPENFDWEWMLKHSELTKENKLILFLHSLAHGVEYSQITLMHIGYYDKDSLCTIIKSNTHGIDDKALYTLLNNSLLRDENNNPVTSLGSVWYQQRGFFKCRPGKGRLRDVAEKIASLPQNLLNRST